jgi:hypothetical protein
MRREERDNSRETKGGGEREPTRVRSEGERHVERGTTEGETTEREGNRLCSLLWWK